MKNIEENSTNKAWITYRTHRDELIGMIHHSDKQIEQNDNVDDGERSEHEESGESSELLDPGQFKVVQVYEAENGPEESL